jgi:hypothetical protein
MELSEYVDELTIAALQRLLPGMTFEPILIPLPRPRSSEELSITPPIPRPSEFSVFLNLPAAPSADYYFRLYLLPEKQIHAVLLDVETTEYFWYMGFEDAAFNNSVEKLDKAFLETFESLVSHETSVVR